MKTFAFAAVIVVALTNNQASAFGCKKKQAAMSYTPVSCDRGAGSLSQYPLGSGQCPAGYGQYPGGVGQYPGVYGQSVGYGLPWGGGYAGYG